MDELHGILIEYEMRPGKETPSKGETIFKASKEKKNQEQMSNEDQSEISAEQVTNFIKKLKKGIGKYNGKLPLKCFNYGRVGHFDSKCPYPKQEESDDEITFKEHKKGKTKRKNKKTFYTKEEISSSEESEDEELEHLFMGIETQDNPSKDTFEFEEKSEVEREVDLEAKLINALDELRKYKNKNKLMRGQLLEF
jgi:hypothetical protein